MLFEVHITVGSKDVDGWKSFCKETMIKPLLIELTHGEHPLQLMCAATHEGDIETVSRYIKDLQKKITSGEFAILRTKLECPLAETLTVLNLYRIKPVYLECHIKLFLNDHTARSLQFVSEFTNTVASENILARQDNRRKWYLTKRSRDVFSPEGVEREFNLAYERTMMCTSVEDMDMECVIYDSNPGLDNGWVN